MSRTCDICHKEATSSSDIYFDVSFSDNGDWEPNYETLVLCYDDCMDWVRNNLSKVILIARVYDSVRG